MNITNPGCNECCIQKYQFHSNYDRVLLVKLVLFGAMLVLAALNRYCLVPRLEARFREDDGAGAVASLRGSLLLESACAMGLLLAVAILGVQDPR